MFELVGSRRKTPFFFLLGFICVGLSTAAGGESGVSGPNIRLKTEKPDINIILDECAKYCDRLDRASLHYVCLETITEERYRSARAGRIAWSQTVKHDYQLIRKNREVEEKRILLERNGEKAGIDDPPSMPKMFRVEHVIYGPLGILGREMQPHFDYALLDTEIFEGEEAYVIKAASNSCGSQANLSGKAWVHAKDYSVLKIEWDQESIENYEMSLMIARSLGARPRFKLISEFGFEKNEIRFPSRFAITEAYIRPSAPARFVRSKIDIDYRDYRFFTVETDIKHKGEDS